MATGDDLRRIALALTGTIEAPHFDRAAFKVVRTYVTLAADGRSANFKFTPDTQEFKCMVSPDVYRQIPNAWGRRGWTVVALAALTEDELRADLETAYVAGAAEEASKRRGRRRPGSSGTKNGDQKKRK